MLNILLNECKNDLCINRLTLLLNNSNLYNILFYKDKYNYTFFMYLFMNENLTYEILNLFLPIENFIGIKNNNISKNEYFDLINCKNDFGYTSLMFLCENSNITYKIFELNYNSIDFNQIFCKNIFDHYPLTYLLKNKNLDLNILILFFNKINNTINFNMIYFIDNHNNSLLMYLCKNLFITFDILNFFFDKLVEYQSNINILNYILQKDNYNRTALNILCNNSNITLQMLELFIEYYSEDNFIKEIPNKFKNNIENIYNYKYYLFQVLK